MAVSLQRGAVAATTVLMALAGAACSKPEDQNAAKGGTAQPQSATPTRATSVAPVGAGDPNPAQQQAQAPAPAATPVVWPNVNFINNPGGGDAKAVALTFDDGPDGVVSPQGQAGKTNMSSVLDVLDKYNLKATFFLCGKLWADAATDALAQADIKRMVAAGHHYGNHTSTHPTFDPSKVSVQTVQEEFAANQNTFASEKLLGPGLRFTMYRAPYGVPFQDGIAYPPTASSVDASVGVLAPGTPYQGVHVGWGIDSHDWQCAQNNQDSNCIMTNINLFLDKGASGPILMHSVYDLTAKTLPQIIDSIVSHGYHIVMVEDIIKAKYGATSADLAQANDAANFDAAAVSQAAVAATMQDKWYAQTNED